MKKNAKLIAYAVAAFLLTAVCGYWAGRQSNRWGVPQDLLALGEKLEALPANLGGWECTQSKPVDESTQNLLQCFGSLIRTYRGTKPNDTVNAAVYVGPAGPISLHDPDVCYVAAGYSVDQGPSRERFQIGPDQNDSVELNTLVLKPRDLGDSKLKVVWGWHDGYGWKTPDRAGWKMFDGPRWSFAGRPFLFKFQLAHPVDELEPDSDDTVERFIRDFLPAIDKQVFGDAATTPPKDA